MSIRFVLTCLILFLWGCNEENAIIPKSTTLSGQVKLYDDEGNLEKNMSGISVTIENIPLSQLTDSLGKYTFADVPTGTYNLKFEYKDYPSHYIQNCAISYSNEQGFITNPKAFGYLDVFGLSPRVKITPVLDSIILSKLQYSNKDSVIYSFWVHYASSKASNHIKWIVLLGKKKNELEYGNNNYQGELEWSWSNARTDSISYQYIYFTDKVIRDNGFIQGDSLYFRVYPTTNLSFYYDPGTKNKIYPSMGIASNIMGTIVK